MTAARERLRAVREILLPEQRALPIRRPILRAGPLPLTRIDA